MTTGGRAGLVDIIERMRGKSARWQHAPGSLDVVYANTVDDWADELADLLAGAEAERPQHDVNYPCGCSKDFCPTHRPAYLPDAAPRERETLDEKP